MKPALLLSTTLLLSPPAPAHDLTLSLAPLATPKGKVRISLFTDPSAFPYGRPIQARETTAREETHQVTFSSISRPVVAVAVHWDLDGDGALKQDWLGRPQEPVAFSNDARGLFGPPSFDQAAVQLPHPEELPISPHRGE